MWVIKWGDFYEPTMKYAMKMLNKLKRGKHPYDVTNPQSSNALKFHSEQEALEFIEEHYGLPTLATIEKI